MKKIFALFDKPQSDNRYKKEYNYYMLFVMAFLLVGAIWSGFPFRTILILIPLFLFMCVLLRFNPFVSGAIKNKTIKIIVLWFCILISSLSVLISVMSFNRKMPRHNTIRSILRPSTNVSTRVN